MASYALQMKGEGFMAEAQMQEVPRIQTCPICANLYVDTGGGACSECVSKLNEMKAKVFDYVKAHPNARVTDIVDEVSLNEKVIMRILTCGEATYPCAKCGSPILEGKYCKTCLGRFRENLDKSKLNSEEAKADLERRKYVQNKSRRNGGKIKSGKRMHMMMDQK